MKFKKSQSGRSMVEMLGVLAIIGVLSVGGIAGYSLSMRRHRANEVVDTLTKFALISYGVCQQRLINGETAEISECPSFSAFEDADIGNIPAGVRYVHTYFEYSPTLGDIVLLSALFDDDKLCQSVGAITGTGCNDANVSFKIKQN